MRFEVGKHYQKFGDSDAPIRKCVYSDDKGVALAVVKEGKYQTPHLLALCPGSEVYYEEVEVFEAEGWAWVHMTRVHPNKEVARRYKPAGCSWQLLPVKYNP